MESSKQINQSSNHTVKVTVDDFAAKYKSKGEVSVPAFMLHDFLFRSMISLPQSAKLICLNIIR